VSEESIPDLLRRGFAAFASGQTQDAVAIAHRLLEREAELAPAHFLVGLAAFGLGERKTAYEAFATTVRLEPGHDAAHAHLARLLLGEGEMDQAAEAVQKAIRHHRGDPGVADLIGTVQALLGEWQDADRWFRKAVAGNSGHTPYLQNLANNQLILGDIEAAKQTWLRLLTLEPTHAQAHWAFAGTRTATDHRHIRVMQRLLQTPDLHPRAIAFLQYAIGKEHEDLQNWDDAFDAFAKGAAARRETVVFDEALEASTFTTLADLFVSGWNQGRAGYTPARGQPRPVFIVGQPRTGTTLIERILAAHPDVHAAGELQHFHLALRKLTGLNDPRRFTPDLFTSARHLDPEALGRTYLGMTRRLQGDRVVFLDKLPQNYLSIPLIRAALPEARIIHLTREPMDACFASFKQLFADAYLHSYSLEEMARHHVRYRRLMAIWRERFPDAFLDIAYEDTTRDVEGTARRMLEWIGLPWNDVCVRFHDQSGAVATASAAQVRQPVHVRSVGRWQRYEKQLAPVRAILDTAGLIGSAAISG
jgi:tetratricopeptide (TPR) repeat protein